jgi:nucleotide-binding universal stress UspA family protein
MFKRILVPLDGSQNAEKVLPIVKEIANQNKSMIYLLRVVAPLRQSLMASPSVINRAFEQIKEIAMHYLDGIAEEMRTEGLKVKTIIEHGSPAQLTLDSAQEKECDLIIIGTHGETGSTQWRFGGVANKVIKAKSKIALMVIPTNLPE